MKQSTATASKIRRSIQLPLDPDLYHEFRVSCAKEDTNMRAKLRQLIKDYTEQRIEQFAEMNKRQIEAVYGEATRNAINRIHAAGLPTTHGDEKGVYHLYPDGRKEYIETRAKGNKR